MNWQIKSFNELTVRELYVILRLRSEIFVLEQNCLYQDLDNFDQSSKHLWLTDERGRILAYCRILPAGTMFPEDIAIGRVLVAPAERRKGLASLLLEKAIAYLREQGESAVKVEAQFYARKLYEQVGFKQISDVFLDDGIEHIEMIKNL